MKQDNNNSSGHDGNGNHRRTDRRLAHEVNLQLLELILYRQRKKFFLSAGLLIVKLGLIAGLLYMTVGNHKIDAGTETLLTILVTAIATSQAKLTDFWFNNQSDDSQLVREATSYSMDNGYEEEEEG